MLQVQQYLKEKSLEQLKEELHIDYKIDGDLLCLNYNQINSPMGNPISQECRGLILHRETLQVINKSFHKFFNYGEGFIPDIDWASAQIQEKIDGSIISLYHYQNEWHCGTKKVPRANQPLELFPDLTFRAVVEMAIRDMGYTWESFTSYLYPDYSYSFELTSPETQVQIFYPDRKLTLLAAWNRNTLEEIADLSYLPFPRPKLYNIKTLKEVIDVANSFGCKEQEGFVVVDKNLNRIKVKNEAYVLAGKFKDSLYHPRHMINLLQLDKFDDVVAVVPEFWGNKMREMNDRVIKFIAMVDSEYDKIKNIEDQKAFALEALKTKIHSLLFRMRRFKKTGMQCFVETDADSILQLMENTGI